MWLTDTSQIMTVPSFAPVASLEPLWENLRNQTYNKTTKDNYMYHNFNQSCVLKCNPLFQHLLIPWDAQGGKNSLNYLMYMIYTLGNIGPLIKRFELYRALATALMFCSLERDDCTCTYQCFSTKVFNYTSITSCWTVCSNLQWISTHANRGTL